MGSYSGYGPPITMDITPLSTLLATRIGHRHALEDGGLALDPGVAPDADRAPRYGLAAPAALPPNGVKVRIHQQTGAEDGVVAHHDGAGRHQAGAVDFHAVANVDARVPAKGEQGGAAGGVAHHHVTTEGNPAPASDAQPPRARKAGPERVARIPQA